MLVIVDSEYRDAKTDSTGVRIDGPEEYDFTTKVPVKDGMRVRLRSSTIAKSIYPVITGYNDVINYTAAGPTPSTVVLPERCYTGQGLVDEIDLQITGGAGTSVTWDAATGKITWIASVAGILEVPTDTPANAELIGMGRAQITTDVALPNMVDLTFPRWLRLDVTFGIDRGHAVMDASKAFAFYVPLDSVECGEVENNPQGEQWLQMEPIPDINVSTIHVKWSLPDDRADGLLNMNGINHQLVFEVV